MTNLSLKVLVGLGVAGAVGGGGYGIYSISQKDVIIEEVLKSENKELLSFEGTDSDGDWGKKVDEYKSKTDEDPSLKDYEQKTDGEDSANKSANIAGMKKACKKLVKLSSSNRSGLAQARKWCTKSK